MTREQTKALLPIFTAFANGEDVQFHYLNENPGGWVSTNELFNSASDHYSQAWRYRIKRKPREWWINIFENSPPIVYLDKIWADRSGSGRQACVHVREVIEP